METQLYKKVGKKYVKIGPSDGWFGFPSKGLWIVNGEDGQKSETWLKKIDDIPEDVVSYAKLRMRHDDVTKALISFFEEKQAQSQAKGEKGYSYSYNEIATRILDELYEQDVKKNTFKKRVIIEKVKKYTIKFT